MALAYDYALRFDKENVTWGELGPRLLSKLCELYPDHGYEIMKPEFGNPIDWWNCPEALLADAPPLVGEVFFIHLYNQAWVANKIDKNCHYKDGSLMSLLENCPNKLM
jgi:hypothetical protein